MPILASCCYILCWRGGCDGGFPDKQRRWPDRNVAAGYAVSLPKNGALGGQVTNKQGEIIDHLGISLRRNGDFHDVTRTRGDIGQIAIMGHHV